jgi:hypothetical protein
VCSIVTRGWWRTAVPAPHARHQAQPAEPHGPLVPRGRGGGGGLVGETRIGDQFGQHHRHRLQRLDLDGVISARIGMLHREHADRALLADDGHPGKAVEQLFPVSGR